MHHMILICLILFLGVIIYYMNANKTCKECLIQKNISKAKKYGKNELSMFEKGVSELVGKYGNSKSAPYIQSKIDELYVECFGSKRDFTDIKNKYNTYMLTKEEVVKDIIQKSDDVIAMCIRFACVGNYIDFGAMDSVDNEVFDKLLAKVKTEELNKTSLSNFKNDLTKANNLVYLIDNCGEIVLDKVFMYFLKKQYPHINITAVVRGGDTLNDATLIDAKNVGLDKVVNTISNGTAIPGTDMAEISQETKKALLDADVIISKGQGNFETMFGEGLNTYFMFLCKCKMFVERFGLEQFSLVFANEKDIVIKE